MRRTLSLYLINACSIRQLESRTLWNQNIEATSSCDGTSILLYKTSPINLYIIIQTKKPNEIPSQTIQHAPPAKPYHASANTVARTELVKGSHSKRPKSTAKTCPRALTGRWQRGLLTNPDLKKSRVVITPNIRVKKTHLKVYKA